MHSAVLVERARPTPHTLEYGVYKFGTIFFYIKKELLLYTKINMNAFFKGTINVFYYMNKNLVWRGSGS